MYTQFSKFALLAVFIQSLIVKYLFGNGVPEYTRDTGFVYIHYSTLFLDLHNQLTSSLLFQVGPYSYSLITQSGHSKAGVAALQSLGVGVSTFTNNVF
jgi:hypothetical protein